MKKIFSLLIISVLSIKASAQIVGTGNVHVVGTTDNAGDVDVYAYTLSDINTNDPATPPGQTRVMIRMDSPNHRVQVLTAYNPTTGAETWALAAHGDGNAYAIFADAGTTQYFRVINIAATNNPSLQYTLYLSNPPHTYLGGGIVSNDGVFDGFYGIEARTSITFSGTMVDQYLNPVPFSPQTLSVGHVAGKVVNTIQANASGWYSHTVTFPRCTGGGIHLGAGVGQFYNYLHVGPWYSAWPMLDSEPSSQDVFGMNPLGPSPGLLQNGAYGFNQDCN